MKYSIGNRANSNRRTSKKSKKLLTVRRKHKESLKRTGKKFANILKIAFAWGLIIGILITASYGSFYFYKKGDFFVLRDMIFEGNNQLDNAVLTGLMDLELGVKLFDVSLEEKQKLLCQHPWVEKAVVKRRFPSKLRVVLNEKVPVALCLRKNGTRQHSWYGISGKGEFLPDISLCRNDLPVVELNTEDGSTLRNLCMFLSTAREQYPDIFNSISQIEYMGNRVIRLISREHDLSYIVCLESGFEKTLDSWSSFLSCISRRWKAGNTIDLRVNGYVYVS